MTMETVAEDWMKPSDVSPMIYRVIYKKRVIADVDILNNNILDNIQ